MTSTVQRVRLIATASAAWTWFSFNAYGQNPSPPPSSATPPVAVESRSANLIAALVAAEPQAIPELLSRRQFELLAAASPEEIAEALKTLAKQPPGTPGAGTLVGNVLAFWAEHDSRACLRFFHLHPILRQRYTKDLLVCIASAGRLDGAGTVELTRDWNEPGATAQAWLAWAAASPKEALDAKAAATASLDFHHQQSAMSELVTAAAAVDPAALAEWLESRVNPSAPWLDVFSFQVATSWPNRDPLACLQWILEASARGKIEGEPWLQNWVFFLPLNQPPIVAQAALAAPPGKWRLAAIQKAATAWNRVDETAAAAWINDLKAPHEQAAARRAIATQQAHDTGKPAPVLPSGGKLPEDNGPLSQYIAARSALGWPECLAWALQAEGAQYREELVYITLRQWAVRNPAAARAAAEGFAGNDRQVADAAFAP